MDVIIEFIGLQKDIVKADKISLPWKEKMLARDALDYLEKRYPALPFDRTSLLPTVNHEVTTLDRPLKPDDIVCFLPHIGGG